MVLPQSSKLESRVRFSHAAPKFRVFSSVGRASALHAECHQFEPGRTHQNFRGIGQSGRPPGLGPGCRVFESCYPDQVKKEPTCQ